VQDQRELVEHERAADPEQRRGGRTPADQVVRNRQAGDPADQHEDDAEHHVVDVRAAGGHVARPPLDLGADHADRETDESEPDHDADEETEQRKAAGVDDRPREPGAHPSP
jgi:hypothetical protein